MRKQLKKWISLLTMGAVVVSTVFVNDTTIMQDNYKRYLENSIREAVDFSGTPIRITLKSRDEKEMGF